MLIDLGNVFSVFSSLRRHVVGVNDFADKLNNSYSTFVLMLMCSIVGVRQYVLKPISCWCPQEFSDGWENYAEQYCWISDTYYLNPDISPAKEEPTVKVSYYVWVPFVLLGQALLFGLPSVIWNLFQHRCGIDVDSVLNITTEASYGTDLELRNKNLLFVARTLQRALRRSRRLTKRSESCNECFVKYCPFNIYGKASGNFLVSLYIVLKFLYLLNCILQIHFIATFTGTNYTFYGLQMLSNLNNNRLWETTGIFPRVTWCNIKVWTVTKQHEFGVQCVIPANYINEKIYIFLWFWLVCVAIATAFSLIRWLYKLAIPSQRVVYVMKLLRMAFPDMKNDVTLRRLRGRFVDRYLRPDGVFILHLIANKSTDVIACDVAQHLWCCYANAHSTNHSGVGASVGASASGSMHESAPTFRNDFVESTGRFDGVEIEDKVRKMHE